MKDRPNKILVRVPNWLGDTLMAVPAVRAVKVLLPKAEVTVLCKAPFQDLWKAQKGVDGVIVLRKGLRGFLDTVAAIRDGGFDAALVLPVSFSSAFLVFWAGVPVRLGWGGEGRDPFLTKVVEHPEPRKRHLVWEYLDLVHRALGKELARGSRVSPGIGIPLSAQRGLKKVWEDTGVGGGRGFIALSAGATYGPAKRWPLPYWKQLIEGLLKERKEDLLLLGGLEEEAYLRPLLEAKGAEGRLHLLAGRTSPEILVAMLARCKVLITNDTGPMHAAAAAGTPTVALFGSTSPGWTAPFGQGHRVLYKKLECSPCFQRSCPIGYRCLHALTVPEVARAVRESLKGSRRVGSLPSPVPLGGPETQEK